MEYIYRNTPKALRAVAFGLYFFFIGISYAFFGVLLAVLEVAGVCSMEREETGPVRELIYLGVAVVQIAVFVILLGMTPWDKASSEKSCKMRHNAFAILKRVASEMAVMLV